MRWQISFFVSVTCHILLLVALFWVGFPHVFSPIRPLFERNIDIIEAVAIDERELQTELKKIKSQKQGERSAEKAAGEAQKKRVKEEKRLEELRIERLKEAKKLEELKKQKQKEEENREQRERERIEEEKKRAEAEKAAKVAKESAERASAEKTRLAQEKVGYYVDVIKQKIQSHWIPSGQNLSCLLRIRLLPGGSVVGVAVIEGSGSLAFDDSAVRAVHKASPLPVPQEPELWNQFRDFTVRFKPQ